ncbi:neuroparsin-A-like [Homarus americanus]|uniref:Neuroparsin 1-like n=1 Tax=Homarus americanus TaxID=6706 RepID=A0A8J5T559_HOMAM|nr:neuroparsin-A-like [Homarus americanus]KAG7172726.1 neuroparsin 1-like [Homarus americanus]
MRSDILFTIVIVSIFFFNISEAAPSCDGHGTRTEPTDCDYGSFQDWCGNNVCAKGPGQRCGGEWWENDDCGHGMYCANCGNCAGCSVGIQCWFCDSGS